MLRFLFPLLLVFAFPIWALSQVQANGEGPWPKTGESASLRIWTANDLYYLPRKTDKYYSAGAGAVYSRYDWTTIDEEAYRREKSWSLRLDIFTPKDIATETLIVTDRPYASYSVLEHFRGIQRPRGWSFSNQYTAGVLGKYSGGGAAQNAVHRMVSFADELTGWQNEVKPDVILNYRTSATKSIFLTHRLSVLATGTGRLGTLFTDASIGLGARWRMIGHANGNCLRLAVATERKWVGYNATLSGGLFNKDDRFRGVVEPERFVRNSRVTADLRVGPLGFEAGVHWVGAEFVGGQRHVFGVVGVGFFW